MFLPLISCTVILDVAISKATCIYWIKKRPCYKKWLFFFHFTTEQNSLKTRRSFFVKRTPKCVCCKYLWQEQQRPCFFLSRFACFKNTGLQLFARCNFFSAWVYYLPVKIWVYAVTESWCISFYLRAKKLVCHVNCALYGAHVPPAAWAALLEKCITMAVANTQRK